MTDEQLQAIKERAAAATAGTWHSEYHTVTVWHDDEKYYDMIAQFASEADVTFIAAARTDIPALLAEVERLRAELAAVPVDALRFCVDVAHFTYDVEQDKAARWLLATFGPVDGAE